MTEGGFKRWQDDPVRRKNVELQQAAARNHTKLFCPDLQGELPEGLRGLDAAVYTMIRNQIKRVLAEPDEAFLLTAGQLSFLSDYGRTVYARRKESPPLPQEFYSGTVLAGSLHALRQRAPQEGTDDAKVLKALSATEAIVSTADQLRDILAQKASAIQAKQSEPVSAKVLTSRGVAEVPDALKGGLTDLAHHLKMQNWSEAHAAASKFTAESEPKDVLPLFLCAKAYARYVLDAYEIAVRARMAEHGKAELLLEAFLIAAQSKVSPQFEVAKAEARKLLGEVQQLNDNTLRARDKKASQDERKSMED